MVETEGYKAQQDIEKVIYNNEDYFKAHQITKADSITLKTSFDEISIYWDEELRFRPKFCVENDIAKMPIFFALLYGVDDNQYKYYRMIKKLNTKDTFVLAYDSNNKEKKLCSKYLGIKLKSILYSFGSCFSDCKLDINHVKSLKLYKYSYLNHILQDYFLEKLKYIIDNRVIKGTFDNKGIENIILAVVLDLPKVILKLYNNFDFTKKNPKLIYISNSNDVMPIDEVILIVLCHYLGFDVLLFSPNGINLLGDYIDNEFINYFHIGDNVENLGIPKNYLNIRG